MNVDKILQNAIEAYDLYTPSTKKILKILVSISVNNVAIISVLKLSQKSKVSRPIIYAAIKDFEKDGLVEREIRPKSKVSVFKINATKMDEIVERYKLQEKTLKI